MAADARTNTAEAEVKAVQAAAQTTTPQIGAHPPCKHPTLHPFPPPEAGHNRSLKRHKNPYARLPPQALAAAADPAQR